MLGCSDRACLVEQCLDRRTRKSILIALASRRVLPATATETASSILRFAAIQTVERKQDLADLAPQDRFIPAEPVKREVGQIGEAQKQRARSVAGATGSGSALGTASVRSQWRARLDQGRHRPRQHGRTSRRLSSCVRVDLAGLPELAKLVGLHVEQAGFHGGGAPKPPQLAAAPAPAPPRIGHHNRPRWPLRTA